MAFPFAKLAATTLSEYVAPWLAILELYQALGRKEEFEAIAYRIHFEFNLRYIRWGALPDDRQDESLESFPHVVRDLTSVWGRPECHPYLAGLICDTRGGLRAGFPLEVFRDLLLLLALNEDVIPPHAPSSAEAEQVGLS